ncbi:MAG: hypothetical protein B7Y82_11315 [Sphingomonadales bacterium 32-65-25]|nr:MAG: hypothetical protein B7Z50_02815 [Sphingomonadales bacterium 12-62-5]OYX76953.1 MAG: hypothetical protein B7Y82_11315 [Sphingomonadales bacterium 32-65-25]
MLRWQLRQQPGQQHRHIHHRDDFGHHGRAHRQSGRLCRHRHHRFRQFGNRQHPGHHQRQRRKRYSAVVHDLWQHHHGQQHVQHRL